MDTLIDYSFWCIQIYSISSENSKIMSKPNQMYIAILAVSMVLILAYMYMCRCYQDQPLAAKDSISIWGKMGKIIGVQSEQTDEDCESDNFLGMEGYLESRRKCLLKHCGDVCTTTKTDSGKSMILQLENLQSIIYKVWFVFWFNV